MTLPIEPGIYIVSFYRTRPAMVCIGGKSPFLTVKNVVDAYDLRPLTFSVIDNELYVEGELVVYAKLFELEKLT
jgi:hypothetical protein